MGTRVATPPRHLEALGRPERWGRSAGGAIRPTAAVHQSGGPMRTTNKHLRRRGGRGLPPNGSKRVSAAGAAAFRTSGHRAGAEARGLPGRYASIEGRAREADKMTVKDDGKANSKRLPAASAGRFQARDGRSVSRRSHEILHTKPRLRHVGPTIITTERARLRISVAGRSPVARGAPGIGEGGLQTSFRAYPMWSAGWIGVEMAESEG